MINRKDPSSPNDSGPLSRPARVPRELDDAEVLAAIQAYRDSVMAGKKPSRKEILAEYPELASELTACLDALDYIQVAAPQFTSVVSNQSSVAAADLVASPLPLGDFRVICEVGRGGMGVVYEAEQLSLARRVALKVLPFACALDSKQLQRFKNEALAAAQLKHPNIVSVYSVGCDRGVHYYAMEYVEGRTLAAVIAELRQLAGLATTDEEAGGRTRMSVVQYDGHPCPSSQTALPTQPIAAAETRRSRHNPMLFRTAAQLGRQAAMALEHAHQMGVLHRDVKPANLLVDPRGHLWITDFGLAHVHSDTRLTMTGDLLGTLRYMSPEQALAKRAVLDHRSDIYSLGVTLYELLTLEPAFGGLDQQDVLRRIAFEEPTAPRRHNPAIPGELETIVLKAIAKSPDERYSTAQELADDLQRYLNDEPVHARRPTLVQRMRKWCYRHRPVVVTASLAFVLLLIVLAVGSSVAAGRHRKLAKEADEERGKAVEALKQMLAARQAADSAKQREHLQRLRAEELLERQYVDQAVRLMDQGDFFGALPWIVECLRLVEGDSRREESHRFRLAACLLHRPQFVHVWFHDGPVLHAKFSPDGSRVVTASADGTARVWDTVTGLPVAPPLIHANRVGHVAFSPEGRYVLTASHDGTARVWDTVSAQPITPPLSHNAEVLHASFSADGTRVVTASNDWTARVWDAHTGQPVTPPMKHDSPVLYAVFSPDQQRIATAGKETVHLWDVNTAQPAMPAWQHSGQLRQVSFSPDGTKLLSVGFPEARLWDVSTGKLTARLVHTSLVLHGAFSSDGARVITAAGDNTAAVWDSITGQQITRFVKHGSRVRHASFSPDGRIAVTASSDGVVWQWDAATGLPVAPMLKHCSAANQVWFSADGKQILTASDDETARLWIAADPISLTLEHPRLVFSANFNADGSRLATACWDGTAEIWDTATGRSVLPRPIPHGGSVRRAVFSPDEKLLATCGLNNKARVWDATTGDPVTPYFEHQDHVFEVWFSPNGKSIVTASLDGMVRQWDVAKGKELLPPLTHPGRVRYVEFSRDGRLLATAAEDSTARIWEAKSGKLLATLNHGEIRVFHAAFRPDGKVIATAGGKTARLWDVESGQPIGEAMRHDDDTDVLRFSPDGKRLLTGSHDSTARVWDADTGQPLAPPFIEDNYVQHAEFSRDGRRVVTVGLRGTAHVWDTATGQRVSPTLEHPNSLWHATFSPDGHRLATACGDGRVRIWKLPFEDRPVADLLRLAQVLSGVEIRAPGQFVPLEIKRFRSEWMELSQKYPRDLPASPGSSIAAQPKAPAPSQSSFTAQPKAPALSAER